jgi:hypothetical protein
MTYSCNRLREAKNIIGQFSQLWQQAVRYDHTILA